MTTPDPRPPGTPGTDPTLGSRGNEPAGPPPATSTGPATPAPAPQQPARGTGRTIRRTLALSLLIFVTVVLVLFVVFNTQTVDISLVFTDVRAPLVVALLVAAALGGAIVGLFDAVMVARGRRKRR
ncbi:lipopolysaccharide assembly protein LapA domain-containing protein [Blastococcus mobilis]|uniref:Uncharacterized integral membrane protein n=1 Tax=Blastococcus mobilis TaxID=1938746 RepID=A0A238VR28_9ACTN|nr:lipopolysaccharide assembly protein LapA domain-containing protein [Blastococcus mobilis]SNR36678.1 Uncharacterized integral membrane protein [Blastococcus mobilis]